MDHLEELGSAMTRFTELAAKVNGSEHVPGCPDWTTRELVTHLGTVHRWAAAIVLSGQRVTMPKPVVTGPLDYWYGGTADALLSALQAVGPNEHVPNFTHTNEVVGFFARRQMHEVTVHAVDAAQALELEQSEWQVPPEIAADGIDEVLQVFFPRMTAQGRRPDVRCRIRMIATDTGQEWVVGPGSGDFAPPLQLHSSYHSDASVMGTAADLYLSLWHRVSRFRLEFEGTDAIAMFDGPTTP